MIPWIPFICSRKGDTCFSLPGTHTSFQVFHCFLCTFRSVRWIKNTQLSLHSLGDLTEKTLLFQNLSSTSVPLSAHLPNHPSPYLPISRAHWLPFEPKSADMHLHPRLSTQTGVPPKRPAPPCHQGSRPYLWTPRQGLKSWQIGMCGLWTSGEKELILDLRQVCHSPCQANFPCHR